MSNDVIMNHVNIVLSIQSGESVGGIACGPVSGHSVVEAKVGNEKGETIYYVYTDAAGCPSFYMSDESRFQKEIDEVWDENENLRKIEFADYTDFYDSVDEYTDSKEEAMLLRLLVCISVLNDDKANKLINEIVGKAVGTYPIPVCCLEEGLFLETSIGGIDRDNQLFSNLWSDRRKAMMRFNNERDIVAMIDKDWNEGSPEEAKKTYTKYRIVRRNGWNNVTVLKDYLAE